MNSGFYPSISADGRFVAVISQAPNLVVADTNDRFDVFVRDGVRRKTERVSVSSTGAQANRHSLFARISANGRFVAFSSAASNLVGGDANRHTDVLYAIALSEPRYS